MDNDIKCCVLLSTYNGAKYLNTQLQSLYDQTIRDSLLIYIRDDGSSDNTTDIIRKFQKEKPELSIKLLECENVGVPAGFIELIRTAPQASYYAFCDQDDYWMPEKLEVACNALRRCSKPALYVSNYEVVNATLEYVETSSTVENGNWKSITEILYHNTVPGCVMVFNAALLKKVNSMSMERIRMHDVFVLSVAFLTGEIISDAQARIKYRQHENNVLGLPKKSCNFFEWANRMLKLYKNGDVYPRMEYTANYLLDGCGFECTESQRNDLKLISNCRYSLFARIRLAMSSKTVNANNLRGTISNKIKILLHII